MTCKYCGAELEEGITLCAQCGGDNAEAQLPAEETTPENTVQETCEASENEVQTSIEEETPAEEAVSTGEEQVAQAEEAPAPRKGWKVAVAVVCCVVLLAGLVVGILYSMRDTLFRKNDLYFKDSYTADADAAVKAADKVVATMGDKELTNEQLQIYYWTEVSGFVNEYSYYLSYFGLDLSKPLSEQYVTDGGDSWEQSFLAQALNSWQYYQTMCILAEEAGFEMPEDMRTQLEQIPQQLNTGAAVNGFADANALVQANMGPASSLESYMEYMEDYFYGLGYFDSLYESLIPERAELEAFYEENAELISTNYGVSKDSGKLIDVRHILIYPEGGTEAEDGTMTYTEAEWAAGLTQAQQLLDQWAMGEATEESFAAYANMYSQDPGSNTNGGLYTYVSEGRMVKEFNDWCFDESRQYGDTGIVRTEFGYHIMFFVFGDEGWARYTEQEMVSQACAKIMEEKQAQLPMEVNFKKIVLGNLESLS